MQFRSRNVVRAAIAAALLTVGIAAAASPASATVPPSDTEPADSTIDPAADPAATDPNAVEFVQSWTLTAGGGPDGSEIGSRPNLTYQLAPGAVIEDTVVVFNLGNLPMLFRVYATDAFNNDDGQFDLIPGDEAPVDAGAWVALAQNDITLQPGQQATIPFTLTVPADARPGDHVGAIVAGNTTSADSGGGQVVDVERRTGTRLYVQVEGELQRDLGVSGLTTDYDHSANPLGGSAEVSFVVENRGNVRLGGTPVVSVSGPLGLGKQEITLDPIAEILPGQEIDFTTILEDVPALFLDTTSVRIEIQDPAERSGAEELEFKARSFVPPITALLALLLLTLVVLSRRAFKRRRLASNPVAPISVRPAAVEREPQLR